MTVNIEQKRTALLAMLREKGRDGLAVALSGGVDSALLLAAAILACDAAKVRAYTFISELQPVDEGEAAARTAAALGAHHTVVRCRVLHDEAVRFNRRERCYVCKKRLFQALYAQAAADAAPGAALCVADGTNVDDLTKFRPGLRALRELGVVSPLAECGFSKSEVRQLAAEWQLEVAARPSSPCLATRLPYDVTLEPEVLRRIEEGEKWLRDNGAATVRLRLHGETARLELLPEDWPAFLARRAELCRRLHELGFRYITLDLEGFRSGSMD